MNKLTTQLEKYFGYKKFLPGQEEIINSILNKQNTLAVMPTGAGKSLCYQLPALLMEGVAIVISPLIALMKDQYDSLIKINYPATFINSSITMEEYANRLIAAKNEQYKLIYIAPERLNSDYFLKLLQELKISFIAVDEAHCISEWGHDFRPAYLNIANIITNININISHIIALTATATSDVQVDIISTLNMKEPNLLIKGFDRPNLSYNTEYTNKKKEQTLNIINQTKKGATIIYAPSRKTTEEIYNYLLNNDISVTYYHAGLEDEIRKENQDKFINNKCNVIVATNAFGMGIDKPDVRNVIHISLTSNIESYYQEAGRAGRDGKPSNCYLLWNFSDKKIQEWFINNTFPTPEEFERVYDYIYSFEKNIFVYSKEQFSKILNISTNKISYILKQLHILEIIERVTTQPYPKIRFFYPKNELINIINSLNAKAKPVLDALIRTFIEVPNNFIEINIELIAKKYLIKINDFIKGLEILIKQKIIDFQEIIYPNSIKILKPKTNFNEIKIDFKKNEMRKSLSIKKYETMIEYAMTSKCKRNFILEYFSDNFDGKCEKCSSCSGTNKINNNFRNIILSAATELNGRFGRTILMTYLKGTKNEMQNKYNLQKGKYFGKLKKSSNAEIMFEIDKYIELKYLEKSKSEYPMILITNEGKKLLKNEIKPLLNAKNEYFFENKFYENENKFYENDNKFYKNENKFYENENKFYENENKFPKSKIIIKKQANSELINDENIAQKIDNLFKNGDNISIIAKKLRTNNGKIAEIMQNAIENGIISDYSPYINPETYQKIRKIIETKNVYFLHNIQSKLDIPIDFALLRIIVAFVKKELNNL